MSDMKIGHVDRLIAGSGPTGAKEMTEEELKMLNGAGAAASAANTYFFSTGAPSEASAKKPGVTPGGVETSATKKTAQVTEEYL